MSAALIPAPQRFVVLDSFRGLCALCVVLFHLHIVGGLTELDFFRSAGLFVEFFFTLSGFVLCHGYAQKDFDADRGRSFLISRSFRIFPLHLALLLIFTLLEFGRWWLGADSYASGAALREWLANALLLHAWLPKTNAFSFNGPAWSISVEFYIYLLFGLILFATSRYRKLVFLLIALACTAAVLMDSGVIGKGGFRGITCFFLGALAHEAYRRSRHWIVPRGLIQGLEIAMLAAMYFCLTLQYAHKSFWASCFFALFILLFAREGGWISRQLQRPAFAQLGHWSFSIYLTHYLLIHLLTMAVQKWQAEHGWIAAVRLVADGPLYLTTGHWSGNLLLTVALLALVLWVSSLTYRHIEQRGMAMGKHWVQRRRMAAVASNLALEKT